MEVARGAGAGGLLSRRKGRGPDLGRAKRRSALSPARPHLDFLPFIDMRFCSLPGVCAEAMEAVC